MEICSQFLKKFLEFCLWILFLIFGLIVYIQTPTGQKQAWHFLSSKIEEQTGYQVKIDSWEFNLPLKFSLTGIVVSKNATLIAQLNHLEFACNPSKLVEGEFEFSFLRGDQLTLPLTSGSDQNVHFSHYLDAAASLPFTFNVQEIAFSQIRLPVDSMQSTLLNIRGWLSNRSSARILTGHLLLGAKVENSMTTWADIEIDIQPEQWTGSVHLLDPPGWEHAESKAAFVLLPGQGPSHADSSLHGNISLTFNQFQLQENALISGQVNLNLAIQNLLLNPKIMADIHLSNGTYESLDETLLLENIQAELKTDPFTDQQLLLTQFYAKANKEGDIQAAGSMIMDPIHSFPFEINLQAQRISILNSEYAQLVASGSLILKGDANHAILSGNLSSDKGIIHLEEALPKSIKTIDFQYINGSAEELPLGNKISKPPFLHLDLEFHILNKLFIEGNHLKSEWKGNVHLGGTLQDPSMDGEILLSKGEYQLNDKPFRLSQGAIHFTGSGGKNSSLYVVAEREIDKIRAEMIVKGPISNLTLSFRSSPPLSQREILSYILFERGLGDISSEQGDLLAHSFISLNKIETTSGDNFLTRLKRNIGIIDRLEVDDRGVHVGKYLTDKLFVSFKKGINTLDNRFTVEAKLHKNLKAEAEIDMGGDGEGKVSLKWKKEY